MDKLYEKIGRQQVELEEMHSEYDKLLALTKMLATGEVVPSRVTVNLETRTWKLAPEPPTAVDIPEAASRN